MATLAILKSMHTLDNRQFTRGLRDSEKRSRGASKSIARHARQMGSSMRAFTNRVFDARAAIGVLAGSAGIGLLVRQQLQQIQTTQRVVEVSGFAARSIEALTSQASDYGISQERVNDALIDFSERIGEARTGTGEAVDAIEQLENLTGRQIDITQNVSEVWRQYVAALNEVDDSSDRASIAAQVGGDALRDILPVINEGADSYERAAEEVERLGLAFDETEAAQVQRANEAIAEMQRAFTGVARELAIELAPFIEAAADEIREMAQNSIDFNRVFAEAGGNALMIIGNMADGVRGIRIAIKGWEVVSAGFAAVFHGVIGGVVRGMAEMVDEINRLANKAIQGFNRIPGIDLALIPTDMTESAFVQRFEGIMKIAEDRVVKMRSELHNMMMEPLPSEGIDQFVQDIQERASELSLGDGEEGGPGGTSPGPEALIEFEENLEHLRVLEQEHQNKVVSIRSAGQSRLMSQNEQFLSSLEAAQAASGATQAGIFAETFAQISATGAQHSKEMFQLNKAAGIAEAIISTYRGAAKALELGWPMGPIAAAAISASGFAKVQAIRSQSFQGGGGAAPSQSAGGGVPAVQNVSGQGMQDQQRPRQDVVIDIAGDDDRLLSKRQLRRLMEDIDEELGDDASVGSLRVA